MSTPSNPSFRLMTGIPKVALNVALLLAAVIPGSSFTVGGGICSNNAPLSCPRAAQQARHPSARITKLFSMIDEPMFDPIEEDSVDEEDEISDEELLAMAGEWDEKIAPFNTIHLSGRVGGNPEPRYFDDGKVVVNLSLAVKRKYNSVERAVMKIGSGEEETDWFGLEIWGQTAEFVAKYVDKGSRVGVVGTLEIDEWNDRETGELRCRPKVIVRDFDMLETRAEAEARRAGRGQSSYNDQRSSGNASNGGGPSPATGGFFDS
mmetsp:Transcript_20429/g.26339  ORF Transcript_20429/g.26339 Transcript_20429/m.26339 type:complete len:263 (+) Transcript_20429:40-828(+)